jgi:hypothetical protein
MRGSVLNSVEISSPPQVQNLRLKSEEQSVNGLISACYEEKRSTDV